MRRMKTLGLALILALPLTACAAEEDEDPRLILAYRECVSPQSAPRIQYVDDGDGMIVDGATKDDEYTDLACVLVELGAPQSLVANIDSTTALMGRQTEEADGLEYSWSYHPDNGLNMVISESSS